MVNLKNFGCGLAALTMAYFGGCSSNSEEYKQDGLNDDSSYAQISAYVSNRFDDRYSDKTIISVPNLESLKLKGENIGGLEVIFEKHEEVYRVNGTNFLIGVNYSQEENGQAIAEYRSYFIPTNVDSLRHGEH